MKPTYYIRKKGEEWMPCWAETLVSVCQISEKRHGETAEVADVGCGGLPGNVIAWRHADGRWWTILGRLGV